MHLSLNCGVLYLEFCLGGHNQTIPQNGVPVLDVRATGTDHYNLYEQPIQLQFSSLSLYVYFLCKLVTTFVKHFSPIGNKQTCGSRD